MAKLTFIAVILAASMAAGAAPAQENGNGNGNGNGLVAPELAKPTPGQLLDQDYLTSTGETVPRPGASQSAGPTPHDPAAGQQDRQQHLQRLLRPAPKGRARPSVRKSGNDLPAGSL
jgi:hypothetical protein